MLATHKLITSKTKVNFYFFAYLIKFICIIFLVVNFFGGSLLRLLIIKVDYGSCEAIRSLSLTQRFDRASSLSCFFCDELMSLDSTFVRFRLQLMELHVLFPRDLKLVSTQPVLFTMGDFNLCSLHQERMEIRIHAA